MSAPLLEVRDLRFAYGRQPILRGVSLSVEAGDYVSILGPNGAGKTTLIKQVNRLLPAGEGTVRIAGRAVGEYPRDELARWVGYVPQAGGAAWPFSVREFVLMGRYPYLSPFTAVSKTDTDAVEEAMRRTGVASFAERSMDALSGGERQKVLIAAALAQEARLLLLDEPATFLDPHHQGHVHQILRRVNREQGVAVVAVTHDINAAALTSRRIVALREGRVVFDGAPDDLLDNEVLEAVYGVRFLFATHPGTGRRWAMPEAPEA